MVWNQAYVPASRSRLLSEEKRQDSDYSLVRELDVDVLLRLLSEQKRQRGHISPLLLLPRDKLTGCDSLQRLHRPSYRPSLPETLSI